MEETMEETFAEIETEEHFTDDSTGVEIENTESDEPITSPFDPSLIRRMRWWEVDTLRWVEFGSIAIM